MAVPQRFVIDLSSSGGNPHYVSLTDEEIARRDSDASQAQAERLAVAWRMLRAYRGRWLDLCQIVFDEIKTLGLHDLSTAMSVDIAANAADWLKWRQEMRDMPARAGIDPIVVVSAAGGIQSTSDSWAPWPQPPAAPVIYDLTKGV